MLKRLKNLWKLSRDYKFSEDGKLEIYGDDIENGVVRELTTRRSILPKNIDLILGDGKAEFLGEGTAEEFEEQTKKDKGLFGLFGTKK